MLKGFKDNLQQSKGNIGIPNTLENQTFLSSNLQCLSFGMVGYSNSYSYGLDHSKTKPLEISHNGGHFVWISNGFGENSHCFVQISNGFGKNCCHFVKKKRNTIGKPNTRLPLKFWMWLVFQPPLYNLSINKKVSLTIRPARYSAQRTRKLCPSSERSQSGPEQLSCWPQTSWRWRTPPRITDSGWRCWQCRVRRSCQDGRCTPSPCSCQPWWPSRSTSSANFCKETKQNFKNCWQESISTNT